MPSFRLTLAYDGTEFSGSQVQPNRRTVQGELEGVLGQIAATPVRAVFAGRTDRGVHAVGQVAAVTLPSWSATALELQHALNASLPIDLGTIDVVACDGVVQPSVRRNMARISLLDRTGGGRPISWPLRLDTANGARCRSRASRRAAARGDARLRVVRGRRRRRSVVAAGVQTDGYHANGASLRLSGDLAQVWPRQRRDGESARDSGCRGWILAAHGSQHRRCAAPGRARPAGSGMDQRFAGRAGPAAWPGWGASPGPYALASWFPWGRSRRRLNGRASGRWREGARIWNGERGRRNWLI